MLGLYRVLVLNGISHNRTFHLSEAFTIKSEKFKADRSDKLAVLRKTIGINILKGRIPLWKVT